MAATAPDITHTLKTGKTKGKGVMPVSEHLCNDCSFYHAAGSFPDIPLPPADSSVYLFGHNWVTWSLLFAARETGKKRSIWLFTLDDVNIKRKSDPEWLAGNQFYLPHVLKLVPKRLSNDSLIEARHAWRAI